MKTIVITGSTRGIGYGLAEAFLCQGCRVAISGRSQENVNNAVAVLSAAHSSEDIFGCPCDVTHSDQLQHLWNASKQHFGAIDIWINNAGISHPNINFYQHPPERLQTVVATNLLGVMYGSRVAIAGMLEQGHGSLYNMEGFGSDGRKMPGMALYGSTKYALRYLTKSLVIETRGTPVIVGALSPGMVVTDLLTRNAREGAEDWDRAKRIFNILADRVETVTPWLAQHVLANTRSGARIQWLTGSKMLGRFLMAPFRKRELFP